MTTPPNLTLLDYFAKDTIILPKTLSRLQILAKLDSLERYFDNLLAHLHSGLSQAQSLRFMATSYPERAQAQMHIDTINHEIQKAELVRAELREVIEAEKEKE